MHKAVHKAKWAGSDVSDRHQNFDNCLKHHFQHSFKVVDLAAYLQSRRSYEKPFHDAKQYAPSAECRSEGCLAVLPSADSETPYLVKLC